MTGWTPEDSAALDHEIRERRKREHRERSGSSSLLTSEDYQKIKAADPGLANIRPMGGRVTRRRKPPKPPTPKAERKPRPRPKPKQKRSGRWLAETTINKRKRGKTFDTEAEAQAWLDQLINDATTNTTEEN